VKYHKQNQGFTERWFWSLLERDLTGNIMDTKHTVISNGLWWSLRTKLFYNIFFNVLEKIKGN